MTAKGWIVEVVESASGEVIETLGPYDTEPTAEKAERGLNRNLDHKRYHTNTAANSKRSQARIDARKG